MSNKSPNMQGWWRRTFAPVSAPVSEAVDRVPAAEPRVRPWMIGTDGLAMRQCNQAVSIASRTVDPGPPR